MTKAMPFLQKAILLSYDPRRFAPGSFSYVESRAHGISFYERTPTSTEHSHPNGNVVFLTLGNRVGLRPRDTREEPVDDKCA